MFLYHAFINSASISWESAPYWHCPMQGVCAALCFPFKLKVTSSIFDSIHFITFLPCNAKFSSVISLKLTLKTNRITIRKYYFLWLTRQVSSHTRRWRQTLGTLSPELLCSSLLHHWTTFPRILFLLYVLAGFYIWVCFFFPLISIVFCFDGL